MVYFIRVDKETLEKLCSDEPPSKEVHANFRKNKPECCFNCSSANLHGNGWRCRSHMKDWRNWTSLWYWRFVCLDCGKSHCLMPLIVMTDLIYDLETIVKVIVGRYKGEKAKNYKPHHRTQKRWLDRLKASWSVALSNGCIQGALSEWVGSVSKLMEAIVKCALRQVGLFFPSRKERQKSKASKRRKHPAITTHQTCPLFGTEGL